MIRQKRKIGVETCTESIQMILLVYLFLICTALPLYMRNGYYELGEAKFLFYRDLSLGTIAALLPFMLLPISGITKRHRKDPMRVPILCYICSMFVSLAFSCNHHESFWGTDGWRMGFLTEAMILFFFIAFRYFFVWNTKILESCLLGPLIVFGLGLLNRFDIYPIASLRGDRSFISTLGNINWYCGFLGIFLPLGMGLLIRSSITIAEQIFLGVFCLIGLLTAMTQGGESILLSLAAVYAVLFMEGLRSRDHWRGFLYLLILLGAACETVGILQWLFPGQYTYEKDTGFVTLIAHHVGLIIFAAAVFLLITDFFCSEIGMKWRGKKAGDILLWILPYILTVLPIGMLLIQMSGRIADGFGSERGLIWRISAQMYNDMSPLHKMIGIGQDAYASCADSIPKVLREIQNEFGNSRLTNAHGDLLNILVTKGAAGVMVYLWMLFTGEKIMVQRLMMQEKKSENVSEKICEKDQSCDLQNTALIGLLILASYLAGNTVSFGQITSTPYLFIFLGCSMMYIKPKDRQAEADDLKQKK